MRRITLQPEFSPQHEARAPGTTERSPSTLSGFSTSNLLMDSRVVRLEVNIVVRTVRPRSQKIPTTFFPGPRRRFRPRLLEFPTVGGWLSGSLSQAALLPESKPHRSRRSAGKGYRL